MSPPTTPTGMRPIPLGRGLQQGADEHLLAPGSMGTAHNVLVDRAGRYEKRLPWSLVPRLNGDGDPIDGACDRVDVFGQRWLRTTSQQLGAEDGQVRAYASSGRWYGVGFLPPWQTQHAPLVRTQVPNLQCATTVVGLNRLTIWQHAFSSASFETWARLTDSRGAVVERDFQIHTARITSPVLVQLSGGAVALVVYAGNPDVRAARFDATTLNDVALFATPALIFDACATDTGDLMLLARNEVLTSIVDLRLYDAALTVASSGSVTIPGSAVAQRIAVCDASNVAEKRLAVVVEVTDVVSGVITYDLLLWRLSNTLAVVGGSPITVETGVHEILAVTMGVDRTGRTWVCWYGRMVSTDQPTLHIRHLPAASNVVNATRKRVWRVYPAAAPRRTDRGLVLPLYAYGTGESHVGLVQLDGDTSTDEPPRYLGVAVRQVAEVAPGFIPQFQRLNAEGTGYTFAAAVVVRAERSVFGGVVGVDLVTLDPIGRRVAPADALPQQYVWATSTLWGTDGYGLHDVAILQPPALREAPPTLGGGASFAPGGYLYRARYEIIDDAGVLHVSPWSNDLVVVIGSPSTTVEINVLIDTTQLTAHGRQGVFRRLSVGLYRSAVDGVVDGVGTLYRLTQYGAGATVVPLNVQTVTYADGEFNADSVGRGFVTTAGGRLESRPPPPASAMLAHLGRLWLASNEPGCSVWFSQAILTDEAPSFHEGLTVQFTDWSGPLTGLAGFDDKVIAFSPDRIGYVSGQGPTDTGEGGWAGPYPIAAPWGCIEPRSVISTAKGAYFLAPVGICVLSRSLEVSLVGDAVRDLVEQPGAEIRGVHYDERHARVVFNLYAPGGTSAFLVYDERHETWTTMASPAITSVRGATYDRTSDAMLLTDGGDVLIEDSGAAGDGSYDAPIWYGVTIGTPWLRQTEVGGWGLTHVVHFEGVYGSPSAWTCEVDYDYVEGSPQAVALTYPAAGYAAGARVVQQVGTQRQTSQALRITLRETQPVDWPADQEGASIRAVRWWGMALDAGPKVGPARIDTSLRTGVL